MAQDLQKLKDNIWYAKKEFRAQETSYNEWAAQLEIARTSGVVEPEMMADIEENLAQEEARLHTLREKLQALESQLPEGEGSVVPERKYDPEQHPLLKKTVEKAEPEKAVVLNTGDIVEVRYRDGGWYKAKIVTILGSASAPKYKIKYLEYDEDDTVDRDAVRPLQSKRKRDPEPAPTAVPTAPAPVTSTPHVISGPASVNPKVQAAKAEAQADDLEPKKRKIPNKKQLEKGVANWKNWSSKGVGKKTFQKPSMFRTGDNVNSRVGFTGSGGGMTETSKRVRYDNKAAAEADREQD